MSTFDLNPRLEGDSVSVTNLELCNVRLMKDANYPWLLLIPRRSDMIEITDLEPAERTLLMDEICAAGDALQKVTDCEKLNVAALGNQVSQLHVHVIGRFRDDAAWPGPVWGVVPPLPYDEDRVEQLTQDLRGALSNDRA